MAEMSENTLIAADRISGTPRSAASDKPLPALPFRNLDQRQPPRYKRRTRPEGQAYCPIEGARDAKYLEPRRPPLPPLNAANAGRIWQNRVRPASPQDNMLVELSANEARRNDDWPISGHSRADDFGRSRPAHPDATDDILGFYETHSDRSDAILSWEAEAIGKIDSKQPIFVSETAIEPGRTPSRGHADVDRDAAFNDMSNLERGWSRSQKHVSGTHYVEWLAAERRKEETRIRQSLWRARRRRKAKVALILLFAVIIFAMILMAVGFLVVKN